MFCLVTKSDQSLWLILKNQFIDNLGVNNTTLRFIVILIEQIKILR